MMMEMPVAWMRRITATASSISAGLSPASASSSSSTTGSAAIARAISSSCRWCRLSASGLGVGQVVQRWTVARCALGLAPRPGQRGAGDGRT